MVGHIGPMWTNGFPLLFLQKMNMMLPMVKGFPMGMSRLWKTFEPWDQWRKLTFLRGLQGKKDYNCLSASKDTQSQELVEQFEFVQKATKKRDHSCQSAPKSLRHSYMKLPKLEASSEIQQYEISSDEDDTKTISQIFPKIKLSGVKASMDTPFHSLL